MQSHRTDYDERAALFYMVFFTLEKKKRRICIPFNLFETAHQIAVCVRMRLYGVQENVIGWYTWLC